MNLIKIWDENKNEFDLNKFGLRGLKLNIPSPSYSTSPETVVGRAGQIRMGKVLNPRPITAHFVMEGYDYEDSLLQRDELYQLFSNPFYIGEAKQSGKWWLVECLDEWQPERLNVYAHSFELPLICHKGYSESIGTTLSPFDWDSGLWQWGQGIPYDDYSYIHNTNKFTIYNVGNIKIDPRQMDLKIIINATTSTYMELINHTTGETYRYDGSLSADDNYVIDGIRSTKNGLSMFRNTNKRLITLTTGENKFEVKGATVKRISFDTKFLYL